MQSNSIFNLESDPNILVFDTIDSTSKEAKRIISSGYAEEGLIIVAETQTGGYGRDQRQWESLAGNLAFSFLLEPNQNIEDMAFTSLIIAHSVMAVLEEELKGHKIEFKWPNDILIDGKKFCGIILESIIQQGRCKFLICGVGINVASNPNDIEGTANLQEAANFAMDKFELLGRIIEKFEGIYGNFRNNNDKEYTISFLKDRSAHLGKEITIKDGEDIIRGIFKRLNATGSISLEIDGIEIEATNGDIFHLEENGNYD